MLIKKNITFSLEIKGKVTHRLAERLSLTKRWLWNWQNSPFIIAEEHNYVKSCTQNRKNSSICIVIWKQIINFAPSIHYERRN